MLHVGSRSVANDRMALTGDETIVSFADALAFFRRHALLITGTVAAFLIGAGLYVLAVPPSYVASAKVLIEAQRARPTWQEFGADVNVDSAEVESQAEVLRSSSVAQEVIETLALTDDPEFVKPSATDGMRAATFVFLDHLAVRRVGQSNAIEVAFSASSPTKSARIANEVVAAYLGGGWRNDLRPDAFRRFNEKLNRESLAVTNAQVITAAMPPSGKSAPRTTLILPFAGVSGLLFGMLLAICLDGLDKRIRSLDQIGDVRETILLGLLPIADQPLANSPSRLAAIEHPYSKFSEALRASRSTLDRAVDAADQKCIGVTSVVAGAGATTIAANLAAVYARSGKNVLLLDANFGNPSLSQLLTPKAEKGLIELLSNREDGCLTRNECYGFTFLPLIKRGRIANAGDIMRSAAMAALLRKARSQFDMIFVDLPPSLEVVDDNVAALVDRMIFVAEYRKTHVDELKAAIGHAGHILNYVVLNKCGHPALLSQIADLGQRLVAAASSLRSSIELSLQRERRST